MVLFVADLHGNVKQYEKIVAHARKLGATDLIIGGDICPKQASASLMIERDIKHNENVFVATQREFMQDQYRRCLSLLEGSCCVWVIMGNDDARANQDLVDVSGVATNIHGRRVTLACGLQAVGCAYVPLTPFALKDWELPDFDGDCPAWCLVSVR